MRPLSRRELIRRFRKLGFVGPESGAKHAFMKQGRLKVHIPNPHRRPISVPLQKEILRQAGLTQAEWENA
ncbi:MAG: type II toxin-antitoxin system HicA family toxin [Chloroflexi bacterium]|nr:type II toxin-antitoxin system HicA family toxin [Chloroflexota bacterium]